MEEQLKITYLPLSSLSKLRWHSNPKKHDIGGLIASFVKHGFRDAPIYDETNGFLVGGNGRVEALLEMYHSKGTTAPRGIIVKGEEWYMPVQIGVNALSRAEAEAFAIDHNNLTMMGGEFSLFDISEMWNEGYPDTLASILSEGGEMVTVDGDDVDTLFRARQNRSDEEAGEKEPDGHTIRIELHRFDLESEIKETIGALLARHPEWQAFIK